MRVTSLTYLVLGSDHLHRADGKQRFQLVRGPAVLDDE
jgi:hypothetical protein